MIDSASKASLGNSLKLIDTHIDTIIAGLDLTVSRNEVCNHIQTMREFIKVALEMGIEVGKRL